MVQKTDTPQQPDTQFPIHVERKGEQFIIKLAQTAEELQKTFIFRYQFFHGDDDLNLHTTNEDKDRYDDFCDHLIVKVASSNQIIGTYRLLRSEVANANIGFYSATEFDLSPLLERNLNMLELGRVCIHPQYRQHNVISMLWRGLATYATQYDIEIFGGCLSLPNTDPDLPSIAFHYAKSKNLVADDDWLLHPLPNHVVKNFDPDFVPKNSLKIIRGFMPPLLRGYLSLAVKIASYPAYDAVFNVNDFFVMFDFANLKDTKTVQRFIYA